MRLEGADLLDHRLPQSLLGQCTGPRREGGCSPGRGPADIGTPSELPTGGAPGICPAVSERPVLTRPGGLRRVGRTRPLAPDWVARAHGKIRTGRTDGRFAIRHNGVDLPYRTFDKRPQVNQAAIVENKRLGPVLAYIAEKQKELDMSRSAKAPRRRGQRNHMFKVG